MKRELKIKLSLRTFLILMSFILLIFLIFIFNYPNFSITLITGQAITETVESDGTVGWYSSIALDSQGYAHISYRNQTGGNFLRYCNDTLGSWTCTTIDSSESSGFQSSIAIDSNDKIHIVNINKSASAIRYCNNTVGNWACSTLDSGDSLNDPLSIAIDSNDKIHVSYGVISINACGEDCDITSSKYCSNTGGSFSCATVEAGSSSSPAFPYSIAVNSSDKPHIIGRAKPSNTELRHCTKPASSWTCSNVGFDLFSPSSIAIDSNDNIHLAVHNISGLSLVYCNDTQGSFSCETLESENNLGFFPSIAIDSNDKIHISHYDSTDDDLRYCTNKNETWHCKKLADADSDQLGQPTFRNLAIEKGRIVDSTTSSDVHISWYNNTDLMHTVAGVNAPNITFESETLSEGNYSKDYIEVNVTSEDDFGFDTLTINLYNSTTLINSTSSQTSPYFVNFTDLADGTYYLNATANDATNEINQTETRTILLDTTPPTVSFSCSSSSVFVGETITCTCTATDALVGVQETTFTANPSTATTGDFTTSCTAKDNVNNSATGILSYTVEAPIQGSGTTTIAEGSPTTQNSHLFTNVVPNTDASITSLKSVGIKEIIIEVNQETSNVKIIVKGYNSKPTNVTKEVSGKVYRYLEIDAENLNSNLDKATVKFEVNKSWFPDNSLNKEDLDVYKFNHTSQEWNSLSANYESENGDYYVYTIEINSFSFFAVAEKARIPIISDIIESYDKAGETIFGLIVWWLVFGILLVGIILVGFLIKKEIQK